MSVVTLKSRRAQTLIQGMPLILVQDGKPVDRTLRSERLRIDDVAEEARARGIESIDQIKWCPLEARLNVRSSQIFPVPFWLSRKNLALEAPSKGVVESALIDQGSSAPADARPRPCGAHPCSDPSNEKNAACCRGGPQAKRQAASSALGSRMPIC